MQIIVAILLGLAAQPNLDRQPEGAPNAGATEEERIAQALKLTREVAEQYQFAANHDSKLELQAEPILRWSNPVAGSVHGNVFVWTYHGRPKLVASIFKWFSPFTHMSHEFHSLSEEPIDVERGGKKVWSAADPGIRFSVLPNAPRPAAAAAGRLQQMRSFARRFTAEKTDRDNVSRDLRLLVQPVFRYQSTQENVLDGAMFVFVQGTDPEVWLLLEARKTESGEHWEYALARMNSTQFVVNYEQKEAWRVEIMPWKEVYSHRETYTSFRDD